MSRYHSYLQSAGTIINTYKGEEPFASFLKNYFSQHKKFGSNDRRRVAHLCYCYFRAFNLFTEESIEDKILGSLFLCSGEPDEMLAALKPEWNEKARLSIKEKCSMFNAQYSMLSVFPLKDELSNGIDEEKFCASFLMQPDLFIRLRPGYEDAIKRKLQAAGIIYEEKNGTCIALPITTKLDDVIDINKEAVIQDYSSQQTSWFLRHVKQQTTNQKYSVWDCCAGSGGKSILAKDILGDIDLTVSDIRESILVNLKKRFKEAGIKNYKSIVADLSGNKSEIPNLKSLPDRQAGDIIIADVPCSGSGTWGRTPEQLHFFNEEKLEHYAALQRQIVTNVIPHLADDGWFLYITCSVYSKENEKIAEYIQQSFGLELIQMKIIGGYTLKADTMFAALLQKRS